MLYLEKHSILAISLQLEISKTLVQKIILRYLHSENPERVQADYELAMSGVTIKSLFSVTDCKFDKYVKVIKTDNGVLIQPYNPQELTSNEQ